jgi:hypothetical protein
MEEVRGSSPLSSTAKVLVKAYLILRDHDCPYATEGSGSAACIHHSLGVRRAADKSTVVVTSPFFFV